MFLSINSSPSSSDSVLLTQFSSAAQGYASSATATASFASADLSDTPAQLDKDLDTLLKALASGNTNAADLALQQVQKDLKAEEGSSATGSSALTKLTDKLAADLQSGSTISSLQDVANYLVSTGLSSAVLLNANA